MEATKLSTSQRHDALFRNIKNPEKHFRKTGMFHHHREIVREHCLTKFHYFMRNSSAKVQK